MSELNTIREAIDAIAAGQFVVVVDDEDRENEGDLIIAAESVTAEDMAFMVKYTSGVVCCAITNERADALHLPLMVANNTEAMGTAFTISVDVAEGTSTGISASDRSLTCKALANGHVAASGFARPGHVFPLRARAGGVLKRAGHTEAAVDLATMAGLAPAGVLCEIVSDDGTMARLPELIEFAQTHGIPIISIADMIRYRNRHERLVERFSSARIPTIYGEFSAHIYRSSLDDVEHLAFVFGEVNENEIPLVRVHSECLTGDVLGSLRCDCGSQLDLAMKLVAENGSGAIVYLRGHEGRGIGLGHKMRAYALQDEGMDTVDANVALGFAPDSREYGIGAQIIADLGIQKMRVLTNNPAKYGGLQGYNLEIVERVPLISDSNPENVRYLQTKEERMGHLMDKSNTSKDR
ncbi:MAG: bifunctional 3,4-dihydroxy-2-butanone-4-phosphate synthase/GTP cyclohydrolase II [Acidimicrobiaceae bacterium TMED130]|nr:MAG: bifunctional 3,4-dihydroxy-2-butanone-4-phosphate synthase/GTP cyclohydrolase II [Acidimicrobiaceae bacterium TMED130]|tara:strand:+ start:4275 stop:5501 length:1227 start_codon:yes stop_codon:yes gene_type:complete